MARLWPAWLTLAAVLVARTWLAVVVPLTDTTEARFGEMARKMVESADWLVPQHDYGVPYLAKPPLAFWFSAAGIATFGDGEFGPRAFILLATLGFCAFLYCAMRRWFGSVAALTALIVMSTSVLFFIAASAVMTDMLLTICVTGALLCFWERKQGGAVWAEVGLYVALGLGLLVKGPLAVVLALAPIAVWCVATGQARAVWRRFAWVKGAALALAIALPWYVAAELRNPGFLRYFIVGEHIQRFLVPGWNGDLYGRAHDVPHGTIWLFFLIGALPWGVLAAPLLVTARREVARRWRERREFVLFWLMAALAPLALFTFAGNVIGPYALPALPAAALVLAVLLVDPESGSARAARFAWIGGVAVAAVTAAAWAGTTLIEAHSQRAVLRAAADLHPGETLPLYYWQSRYFSADYYGRGRVGVLEDASKLETALAEHRGFALVVAKQKLDSLPPDVAARVHQVAVVGSMLVLEPVYREAQRS